MDDARAVGRADRARDLGEDAEILLLVDLELGERHAGDEPHGDVGDPVDLARVVDGDDPAVPDARREERLAPEPLERICVERGCVKHLERDLVLDAHDAGAEDRPVGAAPERRHDLVASEPAAGGRRSVEAAPQALLERILPAHALAPSLESQRLALTSSRSFMTCFLHPSSKSSMSIRPNVRL